MKNIILCIVVLTIPLILTGSLNAAQRVVVLEEFTSPG